MGSSNSKASKNNGEINNVVNVESAVEIESLELTILLYVIAAMNLVELAYLFIVPLPQA